MTLHLDAEGVDASLPAADASLAHSTQRLTHAEAAGLSDYEALLYGLPPFIDATVILYADGRIDMPDFRLSLMVEPFNHMHPWVVYRRTGAFLFVGERMVRLNSQQMHVFNAVDAIAAAGDDIAQRLRVWPSLMQALQMPGRHHVLVVGDLPYLRLSNVQAFPAGSLTRSGRALQRIETAPEAAWAMYPGRRYFLKHTNAA